MHTFMLFGVWEFGIERGKIGFKNDTNSQMGFVLMLKIGERG
jgi:hypothetical protein